MLDKPSEIAPRLSASPSAQALAEQARRLRQNPFSQTLRQQAETAFVDYFSSQDAPQAIQRGARMFERARRDPQLEPPLRHVLLQTLDRSLSKAFSSYEAAAAPLCKLAALDTWNSSVNARVLDAIARSESGCVAVPLSQTEQATERRQHALLVQALPARLSMLQALAEGREDARPWRQSFAQHLRRLLFLTLDATLKADDIERLLTFLATPAGRACLAMRHALGMLDADPAAASPPVDPPEMTGLQSSLREMLLEAAGADAFEQQAYHIELAERMERRLHETC